MWTCPQCKTMINAGFDSCWNCGAEPNGREDPDFCHADEYRLVRKQKRKQFSVSWLFWITACACVFYGGIASNNYVFVVVGLAFFVLPIVCELIGS